MKSFKTKSKGRLQLRAAQSALAAEARRGGQLPRENYLLGYRSLSVPGEPANRHDHEFNVLLVRTIHENPHQTQQLGS
jgi:hypothetical protein